MNKSKPLPSKKPLNIVEIEHTNTLKAYSFHSPIKHPPIEDFPLDLTLENFYHPTANSQRPVIFTLTLTKLFIIKHKKFIVFAFLI